MMLDFGSYLYAVTEPDVLARLHQAGLLNEQVRLKAVDCVTDLAINTPDSGWLTHSAWKVLLTPGERVTLMQTVREELAPTLEDTYWDDDEKDAGYDPLEESLNDYMKAFGKEGDHETAAVFALAARRRADRPERYYDDDGYGSGYRRPITRARLTPPVDVGRSIFDDIDE